MYKAGMVLKDRVTYLTLFGVFFLGYAYLAPQYVSTEDDSLFTLSAFFGGISHPPGYPLHSIFSYIFQKVVPFGTPAYKAHLVSCFFGALSICALVWVLTSLKISVNVAIACAAFFGFTPQFLSQSVVAEVYTLNTFLLLISLGQILRINRVDCPEGLTKEFFLLGLILGLGLSNHWPLFVLGGAGLFVIFLPSVVKYVPRIPIIFMGLLVGLLPYVWLVSNSSDTGISFYGAIRGFEEFIFYVLRRGYSGADGGEIEGIGERLRFLSFFGGEILHTFYYLGAVFAVVGLYKSRSILGKNEFLGLVISFLGPSILLLFLLDFDFTSLKAMVFRVYPLYSYVIVVIWIAIFIQGLNRVNTYFLNFVLVCVTLVHIGIQGSSLSKFPFEWAETLARKTISILPPDSMIITGGDLETGVIAYLLYVQKIRNDVDVYNSNGLLLGNRLFDPLKDEKTEAINKVIDFAVKHPGDVFFTTLIVDGTPVTDMVLAWRLERDEQGFYYNCQYPEEHHAFLLNNLLDLSTPDLFAKVNKKIYSIKLGRLVVMANCIPEPYNSELRKSLKNNPYGSLGMALQLMEKKSYNPHEVLAYLSAAFEHCPKVCDRPTNAKVYSLIALVNLSIGNLAEAKELFRLSVAEWPAKSNESYSYLEEHFPLVD